ncbi:MAG: MarR family winged helix-turn-helix transcriptional regulator [Bacteroidales bacterium]
MNIFDLDNSINFLINKTAQKFKLELSRKLKQLGLDLSSDQWSVLMVLSENDGPSQTELASKLYKDRSNLTRILDVMEKLQLIERRRSSTDRREYNVFITPEGVKTIPILKKAGNYVVKKALKDAKSDELVIMTSFLNRIFNNLEE